MMNTGKDFIKTSLNYFWSLMTDESNAHYRQTCPIAKIGSVDQTRLPYLYVLGLLNPNPWITNLFLWSLITYDICHTNIFFS